MIINETRQVLKGLNTATTQTKEHINEILKNYRGSVYLNDLSVLVGGHGVCIQIAHLLFMIRNPIWNNMCPLALLPSRLLGRCLYTTYRQLKF